MGSTQHVVWFFGVMCGSVVIVPANHKKHTLNTRYIVLNFYNKFKNSPGGWVDFSISVPVITQYSCWLQNAPGKKFWSHFQTCTEEVQYRAEPILFRSTTRYFFSTWLLVVLLACTSQYKWKIEFLYTSRSLLGLKYRKIYSDVKSPRLESILSIITH